MAFGESSAHDSDGSESDRKPPPLAVHYLNQLSDSESSSSDDSKFKEESDEAIVARYGGNDTQMSFGSRHDPDQSELGSYTV
jgi:hypothetical protein